MMSKQLPTWYPKGTLKLHPKAIPKRGSKKTSKNKDFQHPRMWLKCSKYWQNQGFLGLDFFRLLGLILEVFGEPKWRPRPSKSCIKKTSTKHMPKISPNWSQRGSQNGAKIIKSEVLEAPCFKGGSQVASRPPPGSIFGKVL